MDAVFTTGSELGWREYFSVSDTAQYDNHAFEIEIASSGRVLAPVSMRRRSMRWARPESISTENVSKRYAG